MNVVSHCQKDKQIFEAKGSPKYAEFANFGVKEAKLATPCPRCWYESVLSTKSFEHDIHTISAIGGRYGGEYRAYEARFRSFYYSPRADSATFRSLNCRWEKLHVYIPRITHIAIIKYSLLPEDVIF